MDEVQKVDTFLDQVGIQIFLTGLNGDEINDTFTIDMHQFPPRTFSDLVAEAQKYSVAGDVLLERHRNRAKQSSKDCERRNTSKGNAEQRRDRANRDD